MNKEIYLKGLRLLARKIYSTHRLRKKLLEKGYRPSEIEEAIQIWTKERFLNDQEYSVIRIRSLFRRGYGPKRMLFTLQTEGIKLDELQLMTIIIEEKLDFEIKIQSLIFKKIQRMSYDQQQGIQNSRNDQAKIINYLVGKGHEIELSKLMLKNYLIKDL